MTTDSPQAVTVDSVVGHGVVQWALAETEVVVRVPAVAATHVLDPTSAVRVTQIRSAADAIA